MKKLSTPLFLDGRCMPACMLLKAWTASEWTDALHAFFVCISSFQHKQQIFISFHHLTLFTMNNTFEKRGLQVVLATVFMLTLGLFGVNSANAQVVSPTTPGISTQSNWVTEQVALGLLDAQLSVLTQTLLSQTPGTPPYNNTFVHVTYFAGIVKEINGGATTEEGATQGLQHATPASANPSPSSSSIGAPIDYKSLYLEAVDLLTI
jgi:hypothetical protein